MKRHPDPEKFLTAENPARLKHIRTRFARVGDAWIMMLKDSLQKDALRFLLQGAGPELRGLFFHWMNGRDVCAYLDAEALAAPFSCEQSQAMLEVFTRYAECCLPKAKGRIARRRRARNRRYAAELDERIALCRAMLAEEARNTAAAPPDVRLLKRLHRIYSLLHFQDEPGPLEAELAEEHDPLLRWTLECCLGRGNVDAPLVEPLPQEPIGKGTPLEQMVARCRYAHEQNRREFGLWGCRSVINGMNDHVVQQMAMLLLGLRRHQLDNGYDPDADESLHLLAWRDQQERIMAMPGNLERLERWVVAGQTAAVLATAEHDSPDDAIRIAGLAHDPLMGAVLLIAVKSRHGEIPPVEGERLVRERIAAAVAAIAAELHQGIELYAAFADEDGEERLGKFPGDIDVAALERIDLATFGAQPLPVRAAWLALRRRKYGMLSLDFPTEKEREQNLTPQTFVSQLEPYRLLGQMLCFHADGIPGDEMRAMMGTLLPLHLRNLAVTADMLASALSVWLHGTPAAEVIAALEECRVASAPLQDWSAQKAYKEKWLVQELKCYNFGLFRYPPGFMTLRRKEMQVGKAATAVDPHE